MAEYLEKEAFKSWMEENITKNPMILKAIDYAPSADAESVRHGHWEEDVRYRALPFGIGCLIHRKCSVCGTLVDQETKYCHNCGAKMDKKKENEV